MSRTARGAITLVDLADGSSPVSAYLSNENHTFSASEAGVVSNLSSYSGNVELFIGSLKATYKTSGSITVSDDNFYKIKPYVSTNPTATDTRQTSGESEWALAIDASGNITVSAATTGADTADLQATFKVVIEYKHPTRNSVDTVSLDLSLSKVTQGQASNVVNLTANQQYFTSDFGGTLDSGTGENNSIVIAITTSGNPGNRTYATSLNGESFSNKSSTSLSAGGIANFATNTGPSYTFSAVVGSPISSTATALQISKDNLGNDNDTLTIKASGANGGTDFVTITKVRRGRQGSDAIVVTVSSNQGGAAFKNNSGDTKTLSVKVYDMADGTDITGNVTNYKWLRDGVQVNVTSQSDRTVVATGGVAANGVNYTTIDVQPDDVDDGSSNEFTCEVTVS